MTKKEIDAMAINSIQKIEELIETFKANPDYKPGSPLEKAKDNWEEIINMLKSTLDK